MWKLGRPQEALAGYHAALRISQPSRSSGWQRNALRHLKRFDEALASSDKALSLKPDFHQALNNRGAVLSRAAANSKMPLQCYDKALANHAELASY